MAIGSETSDECRARSEQTIGGQLAWCGNCELTHKRLGLPCEEHTRWDEREERARLFAQRWPACSAAITAESMRVLAQVPAREADLDSGDFARRTVGRPVRNREEELAASRAIGSYAVRAAMLLHDEGLAKELPDRRHGAPSGTSGEPATATACAPTALAVAMQEVDRQVAQALDEHRNATTAYRAGGGPAVNGSAAEGDPADRVGGPDHKPFKIYARGERRPFDLGGDEPVVFGALRWSPIDAAGNVTLTAEGLRDLCNYVYRDGWRFGNMAPRAETPAPLPPGAVDFKSMPSHKLGPEWVGATASAPLSHGRLTEIAGGIDIHDSPFPDDPGAQSCSDEVRAMARALLASRQPAQIPVFDGRDGRERGDIADVVAACDPASLSPSLDPDPWAHVRVTVGNYAGFVGVVQPRGDDDPPGWSRVRSDGRYGETRLFESKHLATVP